MANGTEMEFPFHRYVGSADAPPEAICEACGVRRDRAIHDEKTAERHGGFQDVATQQGGTNGTDR